MKNVQIVTPKGEALYPHLRTTATFQGQDTGKYEISVRFSKVDSDKLIERLEQEWAAAKETGEMATKRFGRGSVPNLGFREDDKGDIIFKFKTNSTIKTKSGDVIKKTVPIFDAKCKPMDGDIGGGSVVKVSTAIAPYYVSSTNYGLALYLQGVQVLDYKELGQFGSAESMGFGQEEGFIENEEAEGMGFCAGQADDNAEF